MFTALVSFRMKAEAKEWVGKTISSICSLDCGGTIKGKGQKCVEQGNIAEIEVVGEHKRVEVEDGRMWKLSSHPTLCDMKI